MRIPKKIKCGGHWVSVIFPHIFKERSECRGMAAVHEKKLYISDAIDNVPYPESSISESFLHEVLHHASFVATGRSILFDDEEKHTAISESLFQVIRDNKLQFSDKTDPRKKGKK